MRNDTFGRLLKAAICSIANCEGKTAATIEAEVGARIGVAGVTIQRYKAGHVPPDPGAVAILAEAALKRGYLNCAWLRAFLEAASHPDPAALLERLCPATGDR
jgi:hypothetical protein